MTIQIKGLSAHPNEVSVRPGTNIIWTNEDVVSHMMISGPHTNAEQDHDEEKEDHDEHSEHADGEEIDLGFLEVRPR